MSFADARSDRASTHDFAEVAARLARATAPADVFGELRGTAAERLTQLRRRYRLLALAVHPDRHRSDPRADRAFRALCAWYAAARAEIQAAMPAASAPAVTFQTRRRTYRVGEPFAAGDLATLYTATYAATVAPIQTGPGGDPDDRVAGCVLKVADDSQDDDLLANEARALRHLAATTGGEPFPAYLPRLLDSFVLQDETGAARRVNAFPLVVVERGPLPADRFFTLAEVRAAHPDGLDPKQMAWIWRRLLIALAYAHARGRLHGAVLPPHVLIQPDTHGLLLVDWCASVELSQAGTARLPVVSVAYEAWYPPTVLAGAPPTPATDVALGLRCMAELLGGDPLSGWLPPSVPAPVRAYFQGALHLGAGQTDAGQLYRDFTDLLANLWGERRFVPFAMPARC